jgi:hypothetical protein
MNRVGQLLKMCRQQAYGLCVALLRNGKDAVGQGVPRWAFVRGLSAWFSPKIKQYKRVFNYFLSFSIISKHLKL